MNEQAHEAIAHNLADVLENGPRLAWNRKTAAIAIDRRNKRVLKTGFGCMGVGTMWVEYGDEPAEWADLPEQDSAGGLGVPVGDINVEPLEVNASKCFIPISREVLDDALPPFTEMMARLEEAQRQFEALPHEEQARILAEREAERLAAKAARTCPHCGCDPDEHGDY